MYSHTRVDRDTQRPTGSPEPASGDSGPPLTGPLQSRGVGAKRPDSGLAIEASGLTKDFGTTPAIRGIDLAVPAGSVYAVLGPNGAGKTTTIRILATLLQADAGMARVLDHDVPAEADAIRGRVSLTGQFASVDEQLTGHENLVLLARLWGHALPQAKARAGDLLTAFDLTAAAHRKVGRYSGGMRRRLDIAASLIVTPDLWFLDEPTAGLDPHSRNQVWRVIRGVVAEGTTVLLTTQHLDEADELADRIAVIDRGKLIAEGTSGHLKSMIGSGALKVRLRRPEQRAEATQVLSRVVDGPVRLEADPVALSGRITTEVLSDEGGAGAISALSELSRSGVVLTDFSFGQPSLDEVFLALTGHSTERNGGRRRSLDLDNTPTHRRTG